MGTRRQRRRPRREPHIYSRGAAQEEQLDTMRREAKTVFEVHGVSFFQAQVAEIYPSGALNLRRLHNVSDDGILEADDEETVRLDFGQIIEVDDWVWCIHHAGNSFVLGRTTDEGHLSVADIKAELQGSIDAKVSAAEGTLTVSQIVPDEEGKGRLDKGIQISTAQIFQEGPGLDGAFLMERSVGDEKIAPKSIDFREKLKNVPNFALREYVRNSFTAIRRRVTRNEEAIELLKRRVRTLENR